MKKTKYIFILIIPLFSFWSCDELDGPTYYEENTIIVGDTINKILLEEFTGHKCGYCPRAHEKIEQLKITYGDAVIIPVAFHVGFYALPSFSGDAFLDDYRTVTGDQLDSYFNFSEGFGLPSGMINRNPLEGDTDVSLYHEDWANAVVERLAEPVKALMTLECEYTAETRKLHVHTSVQFLETIENDIELVLYVVENNIVGWQKDYDHDPVDIENYTHKHVFRDVINTTWGENIVTGEAIQGKVFNRMHDYTLNEEWLAENCEVIAYIYNAETLEVIQAENEEVISE